MELGSEGGVLDDPAGGTFAACGRADAPSASG